MNSIKAATRTMALSTAAALLAASPAFAQDVDAALERFRVLMEEQVIPIDWAQADIDGADAVLRDAEIDVEGTTVPIGDIELTGIEEIEGGYRVERVLLPRYEFSDDAFSVEIDTIAMDGVVMPDEGSDLFYGFLLYERVEMGSLILEMGGQGVFSMDDMWAEIDLAESGPMAFSGAAESFTLDLRAIEDQQQRAVLEELGYEQFSGNVTMAGSWNGEDGRTIFEQDFVVDNVGTLGLDMDIGGYTPELVYALLEIQREMSANPEGDHEAQGMAMLGLMQQMTLHSTEVRFEDDGLTATVLDYMGEQQGVSGQTIADQTKAMLPLGLAQIQDEALRQAIAQAVSDFLDDPQVMRVRLAPASPVAFATIVAGAMAAPHALPQTLGLEVTSND